MWRILLMTALFLSLAWPLVPAQQTPLQAAPVAQSTPTIKEAACRFDPPPFRSVTCYDLIVPENRQTPTGRNLRIHAAVFASVSQTPQASPIFYLDGGPGYSPLATLPDGFSDYFSPFTRDHDLVVFDQRGTGYSDPNLRCPEAYSDFDPGDELAYIFQCFDRLSKDEGVDLTAYNSWENAADVNDLRLALGYEQINLYGGSYGTRLGLTVMHYYPESIRSAVLDGVYPPEANIYLEYGANVDYALQKLFLACTNDPDCNAAYPDLRAVFRQTVADLEAEPGEMLHFGSPVAFTAYDFIRGIFNAMYDPFMLGELPGLIYAAGGGDYEAFMGLQGAQNFNFELLISEAQHYSIQCMDEIRFTTLADWEAAAEPYPYLLPFLEAHLTFGKPIFEICAALPAPVADPAENERITSDIPSLILTGEFDPITPERWGKLASLGLSQSYQYIYPALGHTVFQSHPCPRSMALAFFKDPSQAPNDTCIERMPGLDFRVD
jgi:pimeloyl-ACP methyl ester carboxylesterase